MAFQNVLVHMEMAELSSSLKDRSPTFELFRHRSLAGLEYGLQIKCFNLKLLGEPTTDVAKGFCFSKE